MDTSSSNSQSTTTATSTDVATAATGADLCPICWQNVENAIKLPCSHEFCFLCAKGAVLRSLKCPMCRGDVPADYFDHTTIAKPDSINIATFEGNFHWYYEGRNGWWLFDARASQEIEEEFKNENQQCEIMIAGYRYVIDFTEMVQYRKDTPSRRRKIKRDRAESSIKGIAGLRANITFE